MIDIKLIDDVPNLERYLDVSMNLLQYEAGDKTQYYYAQVDGISFIEIEMVTDELLIKGKVKLSELLLQNPIHYFQWRYEPEMGFTQTYCYRPLIEESKKNYQVLN